MAGRLNPRRAVAAVAATLVLSTGVTLVAAVAPADAAVEGSEVPQERASAGGGWAAQAQVTEDGWEPCATSGRIERVEVLLALDRSGSLRNVDLDGTLRRDALHGTRDELAQLASWMSELLSGSDLDFEIDVALVAFHTEGKTVADFAQAATDYPPDEAIDRALVTGGDTDYRPALEQALARFEGSPHADSEGTCRLMVLFTDGIMDPLNTAGGSNQALENDAADAVSKLLTDLCSTVGGIVSYRERLQDLGVSTYVAVLRGPNFDWGSGVSHLDFLARRSKQAILAVTGHVDSPLLGGVDAADDCKTWSEVRAGEVIEIEDIDELADKLANVVGELSLAVRRPRIDCQLASLAEVTFAGDWPHRLAVGSPAAESLCTLTPPLDGKVTVTVSGDGSPAGVTWQIDDGGEPAASRTLMAGEANLPFGIVSKLLPEEKRVGAVAGARVEVAATWRPESQADWPEQPDELPLPVTTLQLDVPDREAYWLDEKKLVVCRSSQRARWVEATGGFRAKANEICTVKARTEGEPPGDFEFELVPDLSDSNPLRWSASRSGAGDDLQEVPRGLPIVIEPGGESVVLSALSRIFAPADDRSKGFEDTVQFALVWYSPLGEELVKRSYDVEVRVPPDVPDLIECEPEAQVTAALQSSTGGWEIVVDSGCRLLPPPQGTNRVTVTGEGPGQVWQLTRPPSEGEQSWSKLDNIDLRPGDSREQLFVRVDYPELGTSVGEEAEFTLVSTRYDDASRFLREQPETLRVTVYLPIADCATHVVSAVRFTPPVSEGEERLERARAEGLCDIDPPPNGSLEIRLVPEEASESGAPALEWRPKSGGEDNLEADPSGVLALGSEDEPLVVGAISDSLPSDRVDPIQTGLRAELEWSSELGHVSKSDARLTVIVEPPTPEFVVCKGDPSIRYQTSEVPEAPLVVDTGCLLLAHGAGTVSLAEVNGFVAGLRWQLPDLIRAPGDPDLPIRIESDGVLPNEPLNRRETFELVSTLTYDGDQQLFGRDQVEVLLQFQQRIRLSCTDAPKIVGSPVEVPEGPLVVSTGCVLEAPASLGEVTVEVSDGEVVGVPWVVRGEVRLGPGDDDVPILIETAEPLPNRRYDVSAEFALAATWHSPDGIEQSVGEQPRSGQAPPEVAVALRARPDAGQAVLIAVALLIGGLLAGWLLLAGLGWRTNRLSSSGAYRLVDGEATATVTSGGSVGLEGFDLAQVLGGDSKPLIRRRGRLRAGDLTIRVRRRWWNPQDLLEGGRAAVMPRNMEKPLVAVAPSAAKPDSLSPRLAPGAVVVALESAPSVSRQGVNRHRARVWILMPSGGKQDSDPGQKAEHNLSTALDHLRKRVAPKPADRNKARTPDPAREVGRRPAPPPRDSRPKG